MFHNFRISKNFRDLIKEGRYLKFLFKPCCLTALQSPLSSWNWAIRKLKLTRLSILGSDSVMKYALRIMKSMTGLRETWERPTRDLRRTYETPIRETNGQTNGRSLAFLEIMSELKNRERGKDLASLSLQWSGSNVWCTPIRCDIDILFSWDAQEDGLGLRTPFQ